MTRPNKEQPDPNSPPHGYQPKETEHSPETPPKAPDGMRTGGRKNESGEPDPPNPLHDSDKPSPGWTPPLPDIIIENDARRSREGNILREAADYLEKGEPDIARELTDMAFGIYGYKKKHYAISVAVAAVTFFILEWLV